MQCGNALVSTGGWGPIEPTGVDVVIDRHGDETQKTYDFVVNRRKRTK